MSLINQVLRDLDTREPLQHRPASVNTTLPPSQPNPRPDWIRLSVWTVSLFLVVAFAVYMLVVGTKLPETFVVQPAMVSSSKLPAGAEAQLPAEEPVDRQQNLPVEEAVAEQIPVSDYKETDLPGSDTKSMQQVTVSDEAAETVAYLPLHDDGEKLEVKEKKVSTSVQPGKEMVVTRAARSSIAIVQEMISQGSLTEAELKLREIIQQTPDNTNAHELLIGLLLRSGRDAEASQQLEQALKLYPSKETLVLLQAKLLLEQQQEDAAIAVLEKQVQKQKGGQKVLAMLAPLYQRQSRYEESAGIYRRLVELAPGQSSNWLGLAVSLEALNRQEEAVFAYKRALLNGNLSTVLQQYADVCLSVNPIAKIPECKRQLLRLFANHAHFGDPGCLGADNGLHPEQVPEETPGFRDAATGGQVFQLIEKYQVPKEGYEFQMLYGVTPELRQSIVEKGHRMRVYVPFGEQWFAYSTRRLKENPKTCLKKSPWAN